LAIVPAVIIDINIIFQNQTDVMNEIQCNSCLADLTCNLHLTVKFGVLVFTLTLSALALQPSLRLHVL